MTRQEYETRIGRLLVGRSISKVIYYEVDYGDERFHFFDDPRFDSLDFGLDLILETNQCIGVTWGDEFSQYGVSVIQGALWVASLTARALDASMSSRWRLLLGREVVSARPSWSWCESSEQPKKRIYYPQDLLLHFEGGSSLVMSALEIRVDGLYTGMMDNIIVFDNVETAREFQCLEEA